MAYPEAEKLKRKGSGYFAAKNQVSGARISCARAVLQFAGEKAPLVIAGSLSLDAAYTEAKDRKKAADNVESRMAELRSKAPDLADLVAEERLSLDGALREFDSA